MADISDVENCMIGLIAESLQLGKSYLPGSLVQSTTLAARCRVYRGWPIADALRIDIAAGIVNVSVFPVPGSTRRTTRYTPKWIPKTSVSPTLTATLSGNVVTFGGSVSANQVAGVLLGQGISGSAYAYRLTPTDTPATIASAFAAMIPQSTATGPVLTLPPATAFQAIVVADQTMWMETRRQEQNLWVIAWCPNPAVRDSVASAIDTGFANLVDPYGVLTDQFPLPDGSSARLLYVSNHTDDNAQKAGIWRRDLRYVVSYPTTAVQTFTPVLFPGGPLSTNGASGVFGVMEPS